MSLRRTILASCLALFCLAAILAGCNKPDASPAESEPSLAAAVRSGNTVRFPPGHQHSRIQVAPVGTARVPEEEVVAPGKIELNPGRLYRVALPVPGRINRVLVGLGDTVDTGQPVLTLESTEVSGIMSAVRQSLANLTQANANLTKAEADLARARDLLADRAIAQKDVLAAEATVAQSKAAVEQALAARDEAMRRLELL